MCNHTCNSIDPGLAAPMHGMDRWHVLNEFGHPMCVQPIGRWLLYGIDLSQRIERERIPDELRCHRRGCCYMWHPYREVSSAGATRR